MTEADSRVNPRPGQSVFVGLARLLYFPLHGRRVWRVAGFSASGAGVGAETALPCPTANFRASAKVGGFSVGGAVVILTFLRVLRLVGNGTFFTASKCLGLRFQPFRVQCQPSFASPPRINKTLMRHGDNHVKPLSIGQCTLLRGAVMARG